MTMTNEKVLEACLQMARKVRSRNNDWALTSRGLYSARSPNGIDGLNVSSMEHALFMCAEIPKLMEADKREKAMRWLGYLQGALTAVGVLTLEEAKKMNMPNDEPAVLTVYEAAAIAHSLRTAPRTVQGLIPGQMPTQATRAAFLRWGLLEEGRERTDASLTLARELELWVGAHVEVPVLTVKGARTLAKSFREHPGMKREGLAEDMPTERLRRAAVRWEDAVSTDEVQMYADLLAEQLDEWATLVENGEAVYEAQSQSMDRAAVSEDHAGFTPEDARDVAEQLRESPSCAYSGHDEDALPTPKLRRAYTVWWNCAEPDTEQYLANHFAELLEEWAAETTAKVAPGAPHARVHMTTTCYVGLGQDSVAIDWRSSAPDMCQVRKDSQISIDELRQVLDVLDAHRKAL